MLIRSRDFSTVIQSFYIFARSLEDYHEKDISTIEKKAD